MSKNTSKFTSSILRDFMETEMKSKLFFKSKHSFLEICMAYSLYAQGHSETKLVTLEDRVEFIRELTKALFNVVECTQEADGTYCLDFKISPLNPPSWDKAIQNM